MWLTEVFLSAELSFVSGTGSTKEKGEKRCRGNKYFLSFPSL